MEALQMRGAQIGNRVLSALEQWDNNRPRSRQKLLGPSSLGGCREYIRATIAGDPQVNVPGMKLAAFIGTAVGDKMEEALAETIGATTQGQVKLTLPRTGIVVAGSYDARLNRKELIDLKGRDGLAETERDGAPFKECVQISVYLVGLIEAGEMDEDGIAVLVYFDRSGKEKRFWTKAINLDHARSYIDAAEDRIIDDIAPALEQGLPSNETAHLRDMPESWCFHTKCPFYAGCWTGYMPERTSTDPRRWKAAMDYVRARAERKAIDKRIEGAKQALMWSDADLDQDALAVPGWKFPNVSVGWKLAQRRDGSLVSTIDVREITPPPEFTMPEFTDLLNSNNPEG
jgi:hypothetical protein